MKGVETGITESRGYSYVCQCHMGVEVDYNNHNGSYVTRRATSFSVRRVVWCCVCVLSTCAGTTEDRLLSATIHPSF